MGGGKGRCLRCWQRGGLKTVDVFVVEVVLVPSRSTIRRHRVEGLLVESGKCHASLRSALRNRLLVQVREVLVAEELSWCVSPLQA